MCMEDKEIVGGKMGEVGEYELELKGNNVCVTVKAGVGPVKAGLTLELDSCALLDLIAKAIPGTLDDTLIALAKAALVGK